MKIHAKKGHMEIIFPVILFLVFTLSALFIILFAARTYQHIVYESNISYDDSTSMAYISRKIHAADAMGNISVDTYEGNKALAIRQNIDGAPFVTYIYAYNGSLRELFCADNGESLGPEAGTLLFSVGDFNPSLDNGLLKLSITKDGRESTQLVTILSEGGNP